MSKKSLLWACGIDPSGYSSCARSYIKALLENGEMNVFVKIENIAKNINSIGINNEDLEFFSSIYSSNKNDHDYFIQHSVPDRFIFSTGKKNIGYTVVEMKPPSRWIFGCNQMTMIMTASSFCKNILIENGVQEDKIEIVPHCHDLKIWNPQVKPLNIKNLKGFNFLFLGDYTPRKNGDLLIKNFIKTFRKNKDVSLTIKAYYHSFSTEDQVNLINRINEIIEDSNIPRNEIPSIYFYGEPIFENLMPRFMSSFDCLVSPHRCEGWGLSLSQFQFLGKPVIATRHGGNLDFMNDDISYLINTKGYEKVNEEMEKINPNFIGCQWPIIDERSLCEIMDFVYKHNLDSKRKGIKAFDYMKDKFSYEPVSKKIIEILKGF